MRFKHVITAALSGVLLAGCAGGGPPPATFDLTAPRVMTLTAPKPARFQLVVEEPTAVRALETDRIMVKPGGAQITYYKGAVWSDRLPHLMQARMVEAFQNTGLVSAVGSRADRLDADMEMTSQLRAFHVEINGGQATAHASLYIKLIDGKTGRMIASRGFESQVATSKS
ncbi:MAG: hypothetical protein D6773_11580, partial [Alphaproteobacteria bacterium]